MASALARQQQARASSQHRPGEPSLAPTPTSRVARSVSVEDRFWHDFGAFRDTYRRLWRSTPDTTPVLGERVGWRRRGDNARATRRLIDHLAERAEQYPDGESDQKLWRAELKETVQRFGEERFGWPQGYRDLLFADAFFDSTVEFARRARAFDPRIALEEVAQALRNVWITNSIQMLLDREVVFSPAIFAYSMLYPYTDNYLDDPGVAAAAKRDLGLHLGRLLAGEQVAPGDARQRDLFRLVEMIEKQYPRRAFPEVSLSLVAIHRAQLGSLAQQGAGEELGADNLLAISVEKGGASVVADAYLCAGRLSRAEASFFFGYGVFLQFLDDLQDTRSDLEAGHATLFSVAAGAGPLDRLAARLYHFMHRVVELPSPFTAPRFGARIDLIVRNCTTLLVAAVADNPDLFSRGFRRALQRRWPLDFAAMRRLRRRAEKRYQGVTRALRERGLDVGGRRGEPTSPSAGGERSATREPTG